MTAASHRILITGANGFVGRWLIAELRGRGGGRPIEILPLVSNGEPVDITNAGAVHACVAEHRPTALVHLAAIAAPAEARSAPEHAWMVNVIGTLNLARAVIEHSPDARFVHVGSSEVYGESFLGASGGVDENALLLPTTAYGATKAAGDIMIGQMARDGLKALRFRPFNHTGPGQPPAFVVPAFANQIARIEAGMMDPVIEVGNLDTVRDFLDVRDVVRAYADAATAEGVQLDGAAVNLASGKGTVIRELLEQLLALSSAKVAIKQDPSRMRAAEIPVAVGNAGVAHDLLGWAPQFGITQTLTAVLEHFRVQVRATPR